jgi:PhzF family phenazine biosynthesis protein
MRIPYYQVQSFTSKTFSGNPAGVCLLQDWPADSVLQKIAAENDLSETAFLQPQGDSFHLRWFTPLVEVDLCGHATLASAFVLFFELHRPGTVVHFQTLSGRLSATRLPDKIELDFPSRPPAPSPRPDQLARALGREPVEVLKSRDYVMVFDRQHDVATLVPDQQLLAELDCVGVIATAPGDDADFVSRFFAPRAGIAEDPVTGAAHCALIPFWAQRLNKTEMFARQISPRGGELYCRNLGARVGIAGQAVIYSRGELEITGD